MTRRPSRPRSLAARLGWRLMLVIAAAMGVAALATGWRAIVMVHEIDDAALQSQARLVAAALPPPGSPLVVPAGLVARFRGSDDDNVFLILEGGRVVAASDPADAAQLGPVVANAAAGAVFQLPASPAHPHGMLAFSVPYVGSGRVVVLQGRGQGEALLQAAMGEVLLAGILLLGPPGLLLLWVGVRTVRAGLAPLRRVSAAAAAIGPGDTATRLPLENLPDEVLPLVEAMNGTLSRLQAALAADRRFLADAAHSLRTPLAVLTARLDLTGELPELAPIRQDVARIVRLVNQLLSIARIDALGLECIEPVDLRGLSAEVVAELAPIGIRRDVTLALDAPDASAVVNGDRASLAVALVNLVENALMHAPAGSQVDVNVGPCGKVSVADRGPGVSDSAAGRIFGRFQRGATNAYSGAGLGLAIVARTAELHGGSVAVARRDGGGAVFTLAFPAAGTRAEIPTPRAPPRQHVSSQLPGQPIVP